MITDRRTGGGFYGSTAQAGSCTWSRRTAGPSSCSRARCTSPRARAWRTASTSTPWR